MTGHRSHNQAGDRCAPVCIYVAAIVHVFVGPRASASGQREFVLWRILARIGEEETAGRGDEQAPTERGQDKSRQCAARSGYCFSWAISLFRQGAPDPRNVRADTNLLLRLFFLHIAEDGDGA
ncbi:hypothetical protein RZS28_11295 [Methylocapsa polymorpha]|uniref:Uncharacterized protein n=1 Tax=Methylocapsa polymorpha TaxID=3080828 RepID=A0ABZ0HM90_9HYPH|nr:hypothetical protein RZS28_11295 [Methylocapsa sp. RX1]